MSHAWRWPPEDDGYPPMADAVPDPAPAPLRVIAMAATQRSGSSLLATALTATGRAGAPLELADPYALLQARAEFGIPRTRLSQLPFALLRRVSDSPRWRYPRTIGRAERQDYMDLCTRRYTTANGVFFIKYMWHHLRPVVGTPIDVSTWDIPVTWIRQRRRDRALQAVSLMRARATDQFWYRGDAPEVAYDADLIAAAARDIADWERGWDDHLARLGLDPPVVWYEDLAADYEAQARRAFDQVGLAGVPVPPPQLRKQGDESSLEWAARFRAERPDAVVDGLS